MTSQFSKKKRQTNHRRRHHRQSKDRTKTDEECLPADGRGHGVCTPLSKIHRRSNAALSAAAASGRSRSKSRAALDGGGLRSGGGDHESGVSTNGDNHDGGTMGDILAQLRRQRAKAAVESQAQKSTESFARETPRSCHASLETGGEAKESSSRKKKSLGGIDSAEALSVLGGYRYDPLRKAYFPESAFFPSGKNDAGYTGLTDVVERRMVRGLNEPAFCVGFAWGVFGLIFRGTPLRLDVASSIHQPNYPSTNLRRGKPKYLKRKKRGNEDFNTDTNSEKVDTTFSCPQRSVLDLLSSSRSEQTILALVTSLQYHSNIHRRMTVVSVLGAASAARASRVVSTVSTADVIARKETSDGAPVSFCVSASVASRGGILIADERNEGVEKSEKISASSHCRERKHRERNNEYGRNDTLYCPRWFAMLYPIAHSSRINIVQDLRYNPFVPRDYTCKSYLHPSVPTFDVRCSSSAGPVLPHVATIVDGAVHYRSPAPISPRGKTAFSLDGGSCPSRRIGNYRNAQFLDPNDENRPELIRGVRFTASGSLSESDAFVGTISCDGRNNENHYFHMVHPNRAIGRCVQLDSPVNDFCFSPCTNLQAPRSAAFAFGGDRMCAPTFCDLATSTFETIGYNRKPWVKSETLCIQYLERSGNTVLCGHRDGSLSVLDKRSGDVVIADKMPKYDGHLLGSITNIVSLQNSVVLAKGSFGSSRLFDVRCLKNGRASDNSNNSRALLAELVAPIDLVHPTLSSKCVGCAVDPKGNMTISPFVSKGNELIFGVWCNATGRFIRSIGLNDENLIRHTFPFTETKREDRGGSVFCELSATVTPGFEMHMARGDEVPKVIERKGSWGLWFKSGSVVDFNSAPVSGGCIHHITFPG